MSWNIAAICIRLKSCKIKSILFFNVIGYILIVSTSCLCPFTGQSDIVNELIKKPLASKLR